MAFLLPASSAHPGLRDHECLETSVMIWCAMEHRYVT